MLFLLQIGSGTSVGTTLRTFIEPSLELQGKLDEPVAPEEIGAYCDASHKVDELNIEEVSVSHSEVVNEVEKNTFKGCTSSDIFSFSAMPTNAPVTTFLPLTMSGKLLSSNAHSLNIAAARDFFDNFSSDKQNQSSSGGTGVNSGVKESEQVGTVHQLFPVYSYEHLGVSDESQSSMPFNVEDSNSSQSAIVHNSVTATNQESMQVFASKMDQSAIDNQIHDMETSNQHVTQNNSVLFSTPEHAVNARSSIESLRQLSQQMNGLIGESAQGSATHTEDSELEHRNQELAAMLAAECQKREQLELQLKGYVSNFHV